MSLHGKKGLIGSLVILTTLLSGVHRVGAEPYGYNPVSDQFNEEYFSVSGDFFQGTGVFTPLVDVSGLGARSGVISFPERTIERDASNLHGLYRLMMQRQVSSDPLMRVPDMPNPYSTSVMTTPPQGLSYPPFGQ